MLDFLKRNKKEKELQAAREEAKLAEQQRKEEEKSKLREQQAKIAKHAEGGEKIHRALRNIDLENYEMLAEQKESKLSTGSIEQYIRVIDKIEQVLDDATISDVDTTEIDDDLVQLVALFGIALESGNEKTATKLLKGIAEGVKFTRTPFIYSNEEQRQEIARRRRKDINVLLLLGRCQEYVDRVQKSLEELETYSKELNTKKEESEQRAKEMLSNNPLLNDKITRVKMKKEPLTREIQQYVNALNDAIDSRNKLKASELLKGKKGKNLQVIGDTMTNINLVAFGTPELFGNVAIEQLDHLYEDFKEDVKAAAKEEERLKNLNEAVETTIETMFQHEISDKDIQKMREFYGDLQAEKEEEEKRKKAVKEQKRKEEEERERKQKEKEREEQMEASRQKHSEDHRTMITQ